MIYLDEAASSGKKPEQVYQAVNHCLCHLSSNPGRSGHRLCLESARIVFEARFLIARLMNVRQPERVIFTHNATESLNLVMQGTLLPGERAITTAMEHNSVIRPLRFLQRRINLKVDIIPCDRYGYLDLNYLEEQLKRRQAKLLIINHASNVCGTIQPLAPIITLAHKYGTMVLVDAAQSAGSVEITFDSSQIDFLAFSAHKAIMGPQGVGILLIREGLRPDPLKVGGTGSRSDKDTQPDFLPDMYEAGTLNTPGIAGTAAAVRFILAKGPQTIHAQKDHLCQMLLQSLSRIDRVTTYGPPPADRRTPCVSININGLDPASLARRLELEHGILCRAGLQCAPLAHKTLNTFPQGTVRLSMGYFNTEEEIQHTISAVEEIAKCPQERS
jgi:cysteine desulfurase family protein